MQKSHTKVLLLFFFRSHDGAVDSPIRISFAYDIGRFFADVRSGIRGPLCPMRPPIALGFLEAFRTLWVANQPELRVPMDKVVH